MKIEIDIPIEEFDYYDEYEDIDGNNAKSFMDIIVDKVAEKMVAEICGSRKSDLNKMLSDRINNFKQTIESRITQELSEDSYKAIKDDVTERVIAATASKYERSRQYREIKNRFEIENDSTITTGMRALISDIVKAEVKKIIKL